MKSNTLYLALVLGASMALTACHKDNDYDATGTFETTEITLSAEATGRILSFDIEEGQTVTAGQTVGGIDSLQLVLQREQLILQQQAILVGKPDVQKQVAALREQISKQEQELRRVRNMQQSGAATPKQVDDLEAAIKVLRAQLDATLQTLNSGNKTVETNAAAIEVQIRAIEDHIRKCTIASPKDGTVLVKYAEAGEMAVAGRPLMKVADLENMYLRAYFTSDQLSHLSLGQEVTVIADFGGEEQIEYPGRVAWIAAESEFTPKGIQTRDSRANLVYAVKIAVRNDSRLKIGLYGEVKL